MGTTSFSILNLRKSDAWFGDSEPELPFKSKCVLDRDNITLIDRIFVA
jgi:hypothetical protein